MKEIVTIQVGEYANFVGSHFWNFQDELLGLGDSPDSDQVFKNHGLNMDILYRSGETQQGILTYTPRLLSVGFQVIEKFDTRCYIVTGSLGSVTSQGTLYTEAPSESSDVVTWSGRVTTQTSQPLQRNLFLQSLYEEERGNANPENGGTQNEIQTADLIECLEENGVRYWTDFSKVHYHPQSLYELNGMWTDIQHFNNYGVGRDAFAGGGSHGEEMTERLRFFMEECDHIQGLQFIVDDTGGFSGVAAEFLETIADDYTNVPVLLYCARGPGLNASTTSQRPTISNSLHDAISFARLSAYCKLMVPIGLSSLTRSKASRFLSIKDEKPYHSSAVYASAIHSISLPLRMERLSPTADLSNASGAADMNEIIQMLAGQARQNMISTMDIAMPAPSLSGDQFKQSLLENLQPLTPDTGDDFEDLQASETMSIHGILGPGCQEAAICEVNSAVDSAYANAAARRPRFSHLSVSRCPLPVPLPFPSIFGNFVGERGELLGSPDSSISTRGSLDIHSIPMVTRLRSSTAILPFLEKRLQNLRRFGIQQGALGSGLIRDWGFGKDEMEDMGETLSKMVITLNPSCEEEESSESD